MKEEKNPVMELMVKLNWNFYRIRVWWTDNGKSHQDIKNGIFEALKDFGRYATHKDIARAIASMDEAVAAVEVLNEDGDGVVFYPDWK
jgi:DNA-binding GntR family transcriptional regulator